MEVVKAVKILTNPRRAQRRRKSRHEQNFMVRKHKRSTSQRTLTRSKRRTTPQIPKDLQRSQLPQHKLRRKSNSHLRRNLEGGPVRTRSARTLGKTSWIRSTRRVSSKGTIDDLLLLSGYNFLFNF